jgi:ABC-type branched-subunit amino acid transport system substrate-binding protein
VIEDNGSQPPQAVRVVDKLIRRDEVFALLCPFGSGRAWPRSRRRSMPA